MPHIAQPPVAVDRVVDGADRPHVRRSKKSKRNQLSKEKQVLVRQRNTIHIIDSYSYLVCNILYCTAYS